MRRREFTAGLGSAAARPLTARAQQPSMPVIVGRIAMEFGHKPMIATLFVSAMFWTGTSRAQVADAGAGRDVVISKCFACHTDAMFRDQRQDRRGWEATIYRMIGRGGLFTREEIKLMADYPNSPTVGRSGSASERVAVVTASPRSRPALICSTDERVLQNMTCTWPLIKSVTAGVSPRYGT
jgi:mono/diheme cytochrome c family protein